ncbi:MAG: ABC-2 transporter permease [Candidatus Krumholzibacteria bacterium]|nr:ABC-2 transporter permease [Candidatus Krumholzibacteria bacterium]
MKEYIVAEWQDRKIAMAIATTLYIGFFALAAIFDSWDVEQFFTNTAITFWITTGIMGSEADKERRDRLYSLMPIPRRHYSIARIVDLVITKLWLLLFWFVFLLVRPEGFTADKFWYMLSFSVIAMTIILVFVLYHDLGYFQTWRYRIGLLATGVLVIAVLIFGGLSGRFAGLNIGHDALTNNPTAFLVYAVLFLTMASACVGVFMRRRSYVA